MLGKAIEIAVTAHSGQTTRDGGPYILHPIWVMNKVRHLGVDYMIVAILHDVVEDTDVTIEDLKKEGFSVKILGALQLLDMREGDYIENINLITFNDYALQVKLRDIEHNSKITRLKNVKEADFIRMAKYHNSYTIMKPFRK